MVNLLGNSMLIRLQKHIADLGLASRRQAEKLIADGKVKVNGTVVTELGTKIDPNNDTINVNVPKELQVPVSKLPFLRKPEKTLSREGSFYLMLNKPVDISTNPKEKNNAGTLLTKERNIGRSFLPPNVSVLPLDQLPKDIEGLVLFTDDKQLIKQAAELTSRYVITINAPLSRAARDVLKKGIMLGGTFVEGVNVTKEFNKGRQTLITIEIVGVHEHVRELFETIGYPVSSIRRMQLGRCSLGTLSPGRWRRIRKERIV